MPQYPKVLASSQDASQLSLTLTSLSKIILYAVAFFAVKKGLDPVAAQNQVQGLIDVAVLALPAIMIVYHSVQAGWGIIRKLLSYFKTPVTVMTDTGPIEVQTVTPVVSVETPVTPEA